jgi:chorismate mutase
MTADELARLRRRMDALNRRLGEVLQARGRLCREIGTWKRAHGVAAVDRARERAMLAAMLAHAGEGYPRAALVRILRAVFAESRALVAAGGRSRS